MQTAAVARAAQNRGTFVTRRSVVRLGAAIVASLASLSVGVPAGAQQDPAPPDFTATGLSPAGRVSSSKSPTSAIAETSPELLGRTDSAPVDVMIKLDYDSVAAYTGTVNGLDATSPSVTGDDLTGSTAPEVAYDGYIADQEATFGAELARVAPEATVESSLRVVYGGVVATLPANRVDEVLSISNVVAVQTNALNQLLTDSSSDFIGATNLHDEYGGDTQAGEGVVFGVLDSGAWPEHPSLADQGNLGAPPAKADGTPRVCNFGDNPLTPAVDVFACNDKLIGGQAFLTGYLSDPARAAAEPYKTARDSNGHGTHTGTTSAGNVLEEAEVFGVDRGPINGVAPGAWVSVYKVCGIQGCFSSDSASAVQQAILDGVDVINFSISGGTDPATDPVELAFLDAYAAGVFVAASAGNDGPGAATANHLSPWTTTVAASTQTREFQSTLTVTAPGGTTATYQGVTITAGVDPARPIVLASAAPYGRPLCDAPAAPGTFTGKIVACQRGGNARVEKGYNVVQGGAAGMVLFNPALADVETDNHWLPTIHLPDGTAFKAFLTANPGSTATFTAGVPGDGVGDAMAAFSSRGPAGNFVKPDITAPGVQILAGHTPTPESPTEGPPGEYFQAIAGTSMSSPHIAGSAILVAGLHPTWTPGQIKSALMTTATKEVVKEDLVTPADPFDMGAGRVQVDVANNPGLTFDASADDMVAFGNDPLTAVHLNQPSINAPVVPGRLETTRTATNVSGKRVLYDVRATAPAGSTITVSPRKIDLLKNQSAEITITITTSAPAGQYFGEVTLTPRANTPGLPALHLPVAFQPGQGSVTLTQSCADASIVKNATTTCTVTAQNNSFTPTTASLTTTADGRYTTITAASGATLTNATVTASGPLTGAIPGIPAVAPGPTVAGYLPLDAFGITPDAIGDEEILNYNVPSFVYAGQTYTQIGIDSNGYVIVGGGTSEDNECCNPQLPSPSRPNNVIAPFWTDLDGTGAPGIFIGTLTDGVDTWLVVEWRLNVYGTTSLRTFQTWIGVNGEEDVTMNYDPDNLPADPNGQPFVVGAEGVSGAGEAIVGLPTEDLRVTSTDPTPGGSLSYTVTVKGIKPGVGNLHTEMTSPAVAGVTVIDTPITVTK